MNKYLCLIVTILISGCGSGIPPLKLLCSSDDQEVKFETDISTSSLIGTDGTSTKFYKDDFFELVFINFDGSGNPERIINYYPNDPGIEIIENNVSSSWRCKHVK